MAMDVYIIRPLAGTWHGGCQPLAVLQRARIRPLSTKLIRRNPSDKNVEVTQHYETGEGHSGLSSISQYSSLKHASGQSYTGDS